jgi:5'(3')-deoxyribonucleotidase
MKIFVDVDGVIANFNDSAMLANGVEVSEADYPVECGWDIVAACNKIRHSYSDLDLPPLSANEFWDVLDYTFWVNIPLYPVAQTFIKYLEFWGDIYFATTPALSSDSVAGRYDWIKKHFPEYRNKLFICTRKELLANSNSILIDDRNENCDAFEKAGGFVVPVPRPWNNFEVDDENPHPYDRVCKEIRGICQ